MKRMMPIQPTDLGGRITTQRKALGVTAQSTARAAGISRITLHRIEKGETSVNLGAYLQVCNALGLHLDVSAPQLPPSPKALICLDGEYLKEDGPHIRIGDYPQLQALAWQLDANGLLTDEEAIGIYERNQRFLEINAIGDPEKRLMLRLITQTGMEQLLV